MFNTFINRRTTVKIMTSLSVLFVMSSQADNKTSAPIQWQESHKNITEQYILPSYKELMDNTKDLEQSLKKLCGQDNVTIDNAVIEDTQKNFKHVYLSWASVQAIRFGPIVYLKRTERFQYWPDKHFTGGKQLKKILNSNENTSERIASLSLEQLQIKSVAIQGMPALERLLFNKTGRLSSEECNFSQLIGKNLSAIATENYSGWTEPPLFFSTHVTNPQEDITTYGSHQEVATVIFNGMKTQLAIVQQLKIASAFTQLHSPKKYNKSRKLEAWRSQLSMALIRKNLISIEKIYRYGFSAPLKIRNASKAQEIAVLLEKVINLSSVESMRGVTLYETLETGQQIDCITELHQAILLLQKELSETMENSLDLVMSFNALDGD